MDLGSSKSPFDGFLTDDIWKGINQNSGSKWIYYCQNQWLPSTIVLAKIDLQILESRLRILRKKVIFNLFWITINKESSDV